MHLSQHDPRVPCACPLERFVMSLSVSPLVRQPALWLRAFFALGLLLPLALALTPSRAEAAVIPAAETQIASDAFGRTLSNGWGKADQGGTYTSHNPTLASVSNGRGVLALRPGSEVRHTLNGVSSRDTNITATITAGQRPAAGNGVTTTLVVRGTAADGYRAQFRHDRQGRLVGSISKVKSGQETILANDRVILNQVGQGQTAHVELRATGSSTVELSARAWLKGTSRPGWQLTVNDTSSTVSSAGSPGLVAYLSSSTAATTLFVDDLAVTALDTSTPPPPPPPAPPAPPAPGPVGSLPVGQASYPAPSNAKYVVAGNSNQGDGTLANPYRSLAKAIASSPSGSTLVMRGGSYHESVTVPFNKALTIQNYPGEAAWLDGSQSVTGWQSSGSRWYVPGWSYDFDSRLSFTKGVDESSRFLDPNYPMAGHPDQVWVDGAAQNEVGSLSQVVPGTFFVDTANDRLYLGSNPSGKQVRSSTLQKAMTIQGVNTTVRGIGVRRYATTLYMMGALSTEVDNITLENVVVTQNATVGVHGWNDSHTFNRVTITENGLLGLGHNNIANLTLTNSVFDRNNREHFKSAPTSGGVKTTRARNVTVKNNRFADNTNGAGLWFDHESNDVIVTGNTIAGNGATGLMFEASDRALIADNYVVDNKTGLWVYSSANARVWNNTLAGNDRTFSLWQDARYSQGKRVHSVDVHNNVFAYGDNFCPMLLQDLREIWRGQDFDLQSNGNYFHRPSSSNPERFYCWADGGNGTKSYRTLPAFQQATGQEARGRLAEGASILTGSWQTVSAVRQVESQVALALPSDVAAKIQQPAGLRRVGALTPPLSTP